MYNGAKQARGAGGRFGGKVAAAPVVEGVQLTAGSDMARSLEPGACGQRGYADGGFIDRIRGEVGSGANAVPPRGSSDDSFAIMASAGGPGFARPATPDGVRLHMASLAAKGVAASRPDFEPFVAPRAQLVQAEAGAVAEYRRGAPGAIIPVLDERTSVSKHVALILLIIGIIALVATYWWPGK
jgi:hypothetical protein